jgi:hypothetical protein
MTPPRIPQRSCLLNPIVSNEDEPLWNVNEIIRWTDHLPAVFALRMKQLETIHHWLTAYFQAAGFMLQIPGGAEYRYVEHDSDAELWDFVWNEDTAVTLNLLTAALQRLDAAHLLRQIPGGEDFTHLPLPVNIQVALAERDRNGLLNVVADGLDRLLVGPNIPGHLEMIGLKSTRKRLRKRAPARKAPPARPASRK